MQVGVLYGTALLCYCKPIWFATANRLGLLLQTDLVCYWEANRFAVAKQSAPILGHFWVVNN